MYQIGKLVWREWNGCQEFWSWGIVYITLLSAFVVYFVRRAVSMSAPPFVSDIHYILFIIKTTLLISKLPLFLVKMYPKVDQEKHPRHRQYCCLSICECWLSWTNIRSQDPYNSDMKCLVHPGRPANQVAQEKREDGQSSRCLQSDWHWQQWLPRQGGVPQVYQVEL